MANSDTLERLVRRVAAQVRRRRVEHYALRGAFWGSLVAVLVLILKGPLAAWALPLAAAVVVVGALGGALWGALKRTSAADAARLADRACGLEDRVATALDWAGRSERTPLVDALIADTLQRVERLEPRSAARRVIPRDGRLLPVPLALAVVLALAPPIPVPSGRLPDFSSGAEEEQPEQRAGSMLTDDRARPSIKDRLKPPSFEEREFASRAGGAGAAMSGDLSAIFKDTALSAQRPDFKSFLKKGDERLKLLEQADRLPDLQSDFTTSQYKMMFRKSKALGGGLRPDQISPQKLQRAARGDGAARPQGRRALAGRRRRGHGGARGRPVRPRDGSDAARARQDARAGGVVALGQGPQGRSGEQPRAPTATSGRVAARGAGPTIRTSARARACCRARAAAALPRARRPSGCAATRTTSASRASRAADARKATTRT